MPLRYIHIIDKDPTAAMVTQLGLQSRLQAAAEVSVTVSPEPGMRPAPYPVIDLLIVDPGSQSQSATRMVTNLQIHCPNTPVLILTAYDSPLLRRQMKLLGVEYYLAKPVDLFELERVVRFMLNMPPVRVDTDNAVGMDRMTLGKTA